MNQHQVCVFINNTEAHNLVHIYAHNLVHIHSTYTVCVLAKLQQTFCNVTKK